MARKKRTPEKYTRRPLRPSVHFIVNINEKVSQALMNF